MNDQVENDLQHMEREEETTGRREFRIEAKQAEILADMKKGGWDQGLCYWSAGDAWEELSEADHAKMARTMDSIFCGADVDDTAVINMLLDIFSGAVNRLALQLATTEIDSEDEDNG